MSAGPTTFGKYFLTEKIATGGMAEIYLAKLLGPGGFEKYLIIKQIHPAFGQRQEFVELFVQEAKTLVGLSHGNIVPVYELGVLNGTYFIAMEYIDGPTLAELSEGAPKRNQTVAPAVAAYICAEILKGLDYAHRKGAGVIHRDLSPRNVMISRDGEVKIVDFGIAATADDHAPVREESDQPTGSFPYMSPEQVRGDKLSPASDLFSVGILLWETLAGRALFARDTPEETLTAVLEAKIPAPSTHNPNVPKRLDEICLRALERVPKKRFATAGEFQTQLNRYLFTVDPPVTPTGLSSLVARSCPPVPRGREESDDGVATVVDIPRDGTRPMPRGHRPETHEGGQAPRSRRGVTQTFATHVQFKKVLERATPLMPIDAIPDDIAERAAEGKPITSEPAPELPPEPRSRAWVGILAVLLLGAGIFGILKFTGRETTGAAPPDAGAGAVTLDASAAVAIDAGMNPTDAVAAAGTPDARKKRPKKIDAAPKVRKKGILKVGADPWGRVFVDGKYVGNAPGEFEVPAGLRKIRVVGPEGKVRSYTVTVPPDGNAKTPFSDFTN